MDQRLHGERLHGREKRIHRRNIDELPDGAFIARGETAFAVRGRSLLHWTPAGYEARTRRPVNADVDVLTPPSILRVLAAGYPPRWHQSAIE